jgi:cell division protein FtsN
VIMAMSPLVLDDEEAAAADQAASFRPDASSPVTMAATGAPPVQAPVVAAATPRDVGQGDTSDQARRATPVVSGTGQWGIQVGAHVAREKAETQLRDVQSKMRDLLGQAKSAIVELDVRGETFYRVRFGAFTPAKAESLCDQLQKRGTSCLVVTEGPWDAADARASLPIAVR